MRVRILKETNSFCTGCARGCNTVIGSRNDIIHRQTPRENNDVNSTWMCDAGRLDFHWVNSERRLTSPMVKENGRHRVVAWPEAIRSAAAGLRGFAPHQIALIASGRMTNEELFLARKLASALGIAPENVDIVPRSWESDRYLVHADRNPNTGGARIFLTPSPGAQLASIQERVQSGQIRAAIALRENLLNAGFTASGMAGFEFLVQTHVMLNACADAAQVVFPGAAYAEKRGTMINATGRLQRLDHAVQPPGDARDDWEILRDLILALTGQNGLYSIDDVFRAMAAESAEFSGLTLAGIGDAGIPFLKTGETVPLLDREKERIAAGVIVG
jgi:NADH-quinone oxidoreductase subunit G